MVDLFFQEVVVVVHQWICRLDLYSLECTTSNRYEFCGFNEKYCIVVVGLHNNVSERVVPCQVI